MLSKLFSIRRTSLTDAFCCFLKVIHRLAQAHIRSKQCPTRSSGTNLQPDTPRIHNTFATNRTVKLNMGVPANNQILHNTLEHRNKLQFRCVLTNGPVVSPW
ncbi:hypothetical protein SAMN05421543_10293 [Alicyclobacillus macrosporangiidus]|uniref:Uncharacterized protein n=1 Tax=Alicyclobacillus macrosporangiidus TaxID=392015 RepID=A0A1I7G9U2_9BACL|nr:hypothetical protein SAMN05421543_10293 [Alicyclobacillus macrosporangiidus]